MSQVALQMSFSVDLRRKDKNKITTLGKTHRFFAENERNFKLTFEGKRDISEHLDQRTKTQLQKCIHFVDFSMFKLII